MLVVSISRIMSTNIALGMPLSVRVLVSVKILVTEMQEELETFVKMKPIMAFVFKTLKGFLIYPT